MTDAPTIGAEVERFRSLDLAELRREWRRLYHSEPPRISRDLFVLALGYRLQEIDRGGLAKSVRRKLQTMAKALRTRGEVCFAPRLRLKPAARLVRGWGGRPLRRHGDRGRLRIRRDELFLPHQDRPDDHWGGMVRPPLLRAAGNFSTRPKSGGGDG